MPVLASSWSLLWRVRRRLANQLRPPKGWAEDQLEWVARHAPGRSFADVGGLYMRDGEIAFAAEEAGASPVTCFDAGDPDLCGFADAHRARGSSVRFVQGDLEDPESVRRIGEHDLVWCTGVIYHSPCPARQLMYLREITGELLYLSTMTIPEVPGFPQACVYYPGLEAADRKPFAKGYRWAADGGTGMLAVGSPVDDTPMLGHGNCWWGISRSALYAMLATARFEVVEEIRTFPSPFFVDLVARPVPRDPMLPPLSYYRERGDALQRGEERLPFEGYYEERRRATPGAAAGRNSA